MILQVNICWYKSQIDAAFQRVQQGVGPVVSCLLEAYLHCISISSDERSFEMQRIAYQQYFNNDTMGVCIPLSEVSHLVDIFEVNDL